MLQVIDNVQANAEGSSRKLIVNLVVRAGEEPMVRSCEILQKQFRNRTSFTSNVRLKDVFVETIADGLQSCIDRLSLEEAEVFALPHFKLDIPGLVLGNAQLMATKKNDGSVNIIFRFRFFFGGLAEAFKREVQFDDFVQDQNGFTSTKVLSDLAMPLLDLCIAAEAGLLEASENLGAFGRTLAERAHEVRFQIDLVQRYVDSIDRRNEFENERIEEHNFDDCVLTIR